MPFDQVGKFMADLRAAPPSRFHGSNLADQIEFLVLTAVRKDQVRMARWEEFDPEKEIWICSEHKTKKKTGQDYVVPLSKQAMAVLERMRQRQAAEGAQSAYVFPSGIGRGPRSRRGDDRPTALASSNYFLESNLHGDYAPRLPHHLQGVEHRARSSRRGIEMALGHIVGNTVRNIYARFAQKIEPRRLMMQAWADYCDRTEALPGDVIQFRRNVGNGNTGK